MRWQEGMFHQQWMDSQYGNEPAMSRTDSNRIEIEAEGLRTQKSLLHRLL